MRFKTPLLYLALVSLSLSAAALTLGRARGAAWIGQPLDLAVAVQLEGNQTVGGLCAEADVFYADTKIEPARVQISVEAGSAPDGATVRIHSSVPIDEPVVTVYMRAGCSAKSTRRFVLLADYPTESAPAALPTRPVETTRPVEVVEVAPVVAPIIPAAPASPASANASQAATVSAPPAVPAKPVQQPLATESKIEKPAPRAPVTQRKAEPAVKQGKPPASKGARLKLDPLENLTERIKSLEATTTSPPVQEMVQDSSRIQQLQGDVKALLDQAAKNQASLAAMRERLEKAEAEQQIPSLLVYLLLAILAACLTAIYFLWTRRTPIVPPSSTTPPAPASVAEVAGNTTPIKPFEAPNAEHVNLDDLSFEHAVAVVEPTKDASSAFMTLLEPTPKHYHFNAEKMLDMCQQAAFLQSLGKTNEAIALLEKRIRINAHDCPLVYLQLLEVLHQSDRNTDFRVVRNGFMQRFNVNVPESSASFHDEGKALDAYPGILSHITQLWNSPKAIDEIESTVVRQTPEKGSPRFDLAAFRELIMLHGLAHAFTESPIAKRPPVADSEHINLDL